MSIHDMKLFSFDDVQKALDTSIHQFIELPRSLYNQIEDCFLDQLMAAAFGTDPPPDDTPVDSKPQPSYNDNVKESKTEGEE